MSNSFYPGLAPEFDDAAFEPNAGYMFDESSGMDQLQRDIEASLDTTSDLQNGHLHGAPSMAWGYVLLSRTIFQAITTDLLQAATN